ncbi:hypothetical protein VKT23_006526 [Stygiomarasmius scandens]|uniref:Uncharacterized protein n=1 Tax=Marasmiellus scandens TaxID=2682957 RepID=A0ABR1JNP1_9AGAR
MSYYPLARPYTGMNISENDTAWFKFGWPAVGLFSVFTTLFGSNSYLYDSAKLLILGSMIETGKPFFFKNSTRKAQLLDQEEDFVNGYSNDSDFVREKSRTILRCTVMLKQ